jgi:hypothetical protein
MQPRRDFFLQLSIRITAAPRDIMKSTLYRVSIDGIPSRFFEKEKGQTSISKIWCMEVLSIYNL